MTSQPSKQTITIHILTNISREIFFFKNHAENEEERVIPDLFLFFKKALYEVIGSDLQLSFNISR